MWTGLLFGTLGSISTESWPTVWMMMEVNLMSFMPFITYKWTGKKMGMMYFLVQSIGSLMILSGGFIAENISSFAMWITLALLLKNSLAPLHFWGAPLVSNLSNMTAFLFQTWQKIAPIFLMLLTTAKFILWIILIMNLLVACLCSIGSKSIYVLLFFSGMMHMSWLMSAPMGVASGYFILYVMSSSLLYFPISTINQTLLMLNMAGLPPLTGFCMKLVALQQVSLSAAIVLILASSPFLYAYVRLFMMAPTNNGKLAMKTVMVCSMGWLF